LLGSSAPPWPHVAADPLAQAAALRDALDTQGGPTQELCALLDGAASAAPAASLLVEAERLAARTGAPSPSFVASLLSDVMAAQLLWHRTVCEQACLLGAAGVAALGTSKAGERAAQGPPA
jgi:hypothetical protein